MSNVVIPQTIAAILPFLVALLTSYLRGDKLSVQLNGLIALVAIVLTAIACVWLSGVWTSDFRLLVIAILAYVGYLMRNDYQAVMTWLFIKNSPLPPSNGSLAPQNANTVAQTSASPAGITTASTPSGVPPMSTEAQQKQSL